MNCQIRPWRIEDADALAKALNNRAIQDNLRDGLPYPYTRKDAQDYISAMLHADANAVFAFAITIDDQAIGSIGAFRQNNIHSHSAEVGYYLSEAYWGKGLGTSALQQLHHHLFAHTDIIRLFAEPFAHNLPSCRILETSGFILEGVLKKHACKNGKMLDTKLYASIKAQGLSVPI